MNTYTVVVQSPGGVFCVCDSFGSPASTSWLRVEADSEKEALTKARKAFRTHTDACWDSRPKWVARPCPHCGQDMGPKEATT